MKSLVIYDNTGKVYSIYFDNYELPQGGIQCIEIDVPEGKRVDSVDTSVTPHQVILEDIPLSEIQILESRIKTTQEAVDFILMTGGM